MADKDALGDRMKSQYEWRARVMLPRRTWTVIRLDGKAFHSYTRGLERPYDRRFTRDMAATAVWLCGQVQGCRLAYVQSDEISLISADNGAAGTQAWFDANQQKIVSVSASMVTAKFNELRPGKRAYFDSRAFTIADPIEVRNYLVWRQQDAVRNSVSMAAQAKFSPRELHGVNAGRMQDMLWEHHNINWNDYPAWQKRGVVIAPHVSIGAFTYTDGHGNEYTATGRRRAWKALDDTPTFTQHPQWTDNRIHGWDVDDPDAPADDPPEEQAAA